ncbi:predicted protein [Nematostella vectensis]|uniref:Ankyrin repeat domain-containing protein 45 n=1 Tax=Nematostella vectensis TaxID=45351 RepID=A7RMV9_NEMVE|nr:ankyrin repeat domain-containing protein 45 [Nematostella vectensis]EDO47171.1 predicted protein [Nematostella vectensis]|eukprot:XP_001639234.1 predicted protein [Nematostella vectensis]
MGKSLFDFATEGDIDSIRQLFEDPESPYVTDASTELNKRNPDGKSAIDLAAMLGRNEVVRELLERGAEVNSKTKKGYTCLHIAACWGQVGCLKALVASGADLQIRNAHGERAREAATRYNKVDCIEYLDKAEAQFELKALITSTKETIADPDKHMGRFTKDDRVSGNRYCDEKSEWLENNADTASLEEIVKQKEDLAGVLQPILSKLEDIENGNNSKDAKK